MYLTAREPSIIQNNIYNNNANTELITSTVYPSYDVIKKIDTVPGPLLVAQGLNASTKYYVIRGG